MNVAPKRETSKESKAPSAPARGVSARAIVLGALLVPPNAYWVIRMERVAYGPYPSTVSLFANVVFALFVLIGLNSLLSRAWPRAAFSQADLLVIYTMLAISTGLAGLDGVSTLDQMIPHGAWFATRANGWASFLPAFPGWLVIRSRAVIGGHFLGGASLYRASVLRAWALPVAAWTLFLCALLGTLQCVNALVRKQWADRERLTFPIIWLPLAMTDDRSSQPFFRSRLMWAGFAAAGLPGLWNGLATLVPSLHAIPLGMTDLAPYFGSRPWSAITWFPISFYPFVIGLGFLLPLDLLFSCVVFYLFWNMEAVVSSEMAWDRMQDFPFVPEQGFGALVGLFAFYLWSGRREWAAVWRDALRGRSDPSEALSPRAALSGIAAGLVVLAVFGALAGVSWWLTAAFLAIYLSSAIVVTRIRAELGAPVHDFHFMGPAFMVPRITGTEALTRPDMAFLTLTYGLTRAHRADTMPIGLEGLQMAKARAFEQRRMFCAILIAILVGSVATFWAYESQAYQLGAAAHFSSGYYMGDEAYGRMQSWVNGSVDQVPNHAATAAMLVGFLVTLALFALRLRFVGFPLHPIGFAVSSSWAIHLIWFPLLIAWAVKGLILRYGGLRVYRQAVPFFLGMILGDCVIGSLWGLIGLAWNMRTYNFFGA